jgi:hypothetical protein
VFDAPPVLVPPLPPACVPPLPARDPLAPLEAPLPLAPALPAAPPDESLTEKASPPHALAQTRADANATRTHRLRPIFTSRNRLRRQYQQSINGAARSQ